MIRQDFDAIIKHKIKLPRNIVKIARNFSKKPKTENGLLQEEKDLNQFFFHNW